MRAALAKREDVSAAASKQAVIRPAGFADSRSRREFTQTCVVGLFFSITQNYSALLAIVFAQSGRTLPEIGLLISLFAAPTLAATLLSGAICARIGVTPTVRLAMLLTLIGIGSLALTRQSFYGALLSRLVQGAGVGLFLPASMVYVQSRLTRERFVYRVTVFSAVIPLGSAVAPPLGEWTLQRFGPTVLFLSAASWCAVGLLLTFVLRPTPSPAPGKGLGIIHAARRRFLLPLVAVVTGGALYGFVISYLAPALQARGIPLAAFFIPSTAAMLSSRLAAMRRLEAIRPHFLVAGGLLLSASGLVCVALTNNWPLAAVAGVALGAGNSVMFPVVAAWMARGLPVEARAGGQAIASTTFYFGIYATPYAQTFMVGAWGYGGAEIVLAGLAALVAAILLSPGVSASAFVDG